MKDALIVSEVFYSIQGEGSTIGIPAVFLRLAGCNLLCKSDSWVCDTIEVWKKGKATLFENVFGTPEERQKRKEQNCDFIDMMKLGAHLVITGGEPLIHQDRIINFLNWFRESFKFTPVIEIETNGTIIPNKILLDKVDYWNVSPKLPNSGMPFNRRVNEAALTTIQTFGRNKIFKFVVRSDDDILDLLTDYGMVNLDNVTLMPAGSTIEELKNVRIVVVELCKAHGFRFSDRLHISLWDKKTGV